MDRSYVRPRGLTLVVFSTKEGNQEMNPTTLRNEDNASAPVLCMALELSNKSWRLAFSDGTKRLYPCDNSTTDRQTIDADEIQM